MNKINMLLLFTVILLLTVSIVSATSENNTYENQKLFSDSQKIVSDKLGDTNEVYFNSSSNSSTEDGSYENPYKTVTNDIISSVDENSILYVSKGNYNISPISITKNLTFIGENSDETFFISNSSDVILTVNTGVVLSLNNITIMGHRSNTSTYINNLGTLNLNNSVITDNIMGNRSVMGASIANRGTLIVNNALFSNNVGSYGSGIYSFTGANLTVYNSTFDNHEIYNVGGAVYGIRANMKIYDSFFTNNKAVSGAAIYNAFGNLTVNNTNYVSNDARSFYGGSIYSTGISIVENSLFSSNHAQYSGGAITNTNNFTIINCSFEGNTAGDTGGAIENIAWTATENANLTIINSSFIENSAISEGGAIMNYNSTEVEGNYGTIASRNSVYYMNSAGDKGGAISNHQYIDLEYNVFVDNDSENGGTIYSNNDVIKSIEYNWWGNSTPNWNKIGVTPSKWVVLSFTNTTPLIESLETDLEVTLNTLNTGEELENEIPERLAIFYSTNSSFEKNMIDFTGSLNNTCIPDNQKIILQVDNEKIELQPELANITYEFINDNKTLVVKLNLSSQINGKSSIKINSRTLFKEYNVTNGTLQVSYNIPVSWSNKEYLLTTVLRTSYGKALRKNITLEIPKKDVSISVTITSTNKTIRPGNTITLTANIHINNDSVITGLFGFKINGITIRTNIALRNGITSINYTIPKNYAFGTYTITVLYSGDNTKNSNTNNTTFELSKKEVYISPNETMHMMSDTQNSILFILLDNNGDEVSNVKVCYKLNYLTVKTNITIYDGTFYANFTTPIVSESKSLNYTLTVAMGETSKYETKRINIPLIIE